MPACEAPAADSKNLGTECAFDVTSVAIALPVATFDSMGIGIRGARSESNAAAMTNGCAASTSRLAVASRAARSSST